MKVAAHFASLVLALVASFTQAQADSFTFMPLPEFARGINNAGQVVGFYVRGETTLGFLYDYGVTTTIRVPGNNDTLALGINNQSQIVGLTNGSATGSVGFLDVNGAFTTLQVPGSAETTAQGLNEAGQVVGYFSGSAGPSSGFLYDGSMYRTITVPGARSTLLYGINNQGEMVGYYFDNNRAHGFRYNRQGVLTTIDVLGSTSTTVYGINNLGTLVGTFQDTGEREHGFAYNNGVFTTFDAPFALSTVAYGINDSGEVVGVASGYGSFLATPIPEPTSCALLLAGLAGMGLLRFQRQRIAATKNRARYRLLGLIKALTRHLRNQGPWSFSVFAGQQLASGSMGSVAVSREKEGDRREFTASSLRCPC